MSDFVDIIASDVTYMSADMMCVAGWCETEKRMIRPLRIGGHHWPVSQISERKVKIGSVVRLMPAGHPPTRGLPHSREDFIVWLGLNKVGDIPLPELARRLSASESRRVTDVFHNSLREGRYVAAGADCPSLGAIGIDGRHLRFMHRTWEGERRLRCQFIDATGFRFDLPVTASHLRDVETKHGIAGLNASIDKSRRYHLRIGLANPFDNGRAYAMLNGAIPY